MQCRILDEFKVVVNSVNPLSLCNSIIFVGTVFHINMARILVEKELWNQLRGKTILVTGIIGLESNDSVSLICDRRCQWDR